MDLILEIANTITRGSSSDRIPEQLFMLALVLVVLVGSLMLPITKYAMRKLAKMIAVVGRAVWKYAVDKAIEAIIIALLTLCGGLWILEVPSNVLK